MRQVDQELEAKIEAAAERFATSSLADRRSALDELTSLVKQRAWPAVVELEQQKGLR